MSNLREKMIVYIRDVVPEGAIINTFELKENIRRDGGGIYVQGSLDRTWWHLCPHLIRVGLITKERASYIKAAPNKEEMLAHRLQQGGNLEAEELLYLFDRKNKILLESLNIEFNRCELLIKFTEAIAIGKRCEQILSWIEKAHSHNSFAHRLAKVIEEETSSNEKK